MANKFQILSKCFKSQAEAERYFDPIRKRLKESKEQLTSGEEFEFLYELHRLYYLPEEYNKDLPGKNVVAFCVKAYSVEVSNGQYSTDYPYWAIFDNGKEMPFSMKEAVKYVAKLTIS